MYIRILNKNRIAGANTGTFTDFAPYPIDEGCVYTQIYGEELDSFQCRISNIGKMPDNIEPFDRVAIYGNNGAVVNVMCVESITRDMIGYTKEKKYTYELSLCSMTKELEGYILPNLSITPRKIGTRKTVYEYIVQYMDLFAKNRYNTATSKRRDISIDETMQSKFNNLAPELQWNEPTLREVLTSLMMTRDCIPVVKYMDGGIYLTYMDLTKVGTKIENYNYVRSSRSMSDYNSELRMTMQNVMQEDNTVTTSEYIPFTTDSALLTERNFYLETQFPILNIKHLWVGIYVSDSITGNDYKFDMIDLCNVGNTFYFPNDKGKLVYEKSEYDTLKLLNRAVSGTNVQYRTVNDYFGKHQAYCVYFTRGSNRIEGFTDEVKRAIGDPTGMPDTTLNWLKYFIGIFNHGYGYIYPDLNRFNSYYSTYFKVEYETMYNQVFQASKGEKQLHHRIIADNQQFSWVDANTQANLEYQKANRLGNDVVLINGRNIEIELGDTLDDNVVYQVEKQIYTDHTDINAYATKNYILRDKFTAIDAKIRTYVNAQNEAFIRSDLKKFYCEFSYTEHTDQTYTHEGLSEALVSPIDNQAHNESIKYAALNTRTGNRTQPSEASGCYLLNCLSRQLGKSMVFSFGFTDNWVAGKFVNVIGDPDDIMELTDITVENNGNKITPAVAQSFTDDFGGVPLYNAPIGFEDGECEFVDYELTHNIYATTLIDSVSGDPIHYTMAQLDGASPEVAQSFAYDTFAKPYSRWDLVDDFIVFEGSLPVYKDNKEIPTFNIQFEFLTDTTDIMVTNKWVENQKWLNDRTAMSYSVWECSKWNFRSNEFPEQPTQLQGATLQIDYSQNNRAKITLQGTQANKYYFITIGSNNDIMLAFKGQAGSTTLYLNILTTRDTNTYNALGIIDGSI